jgi:hypothetical protein
MIKTHNTTKDSYLHNKARREERRRNHRPDHVKQLEEKRAKNALRSNNIDDLLSFSDYIR